MVSFLTGAYFLTSVPRVSVFSKRFPQPILSPQGLGCMSQCSTFPFPLVPALLKSLFPSPRKWHLVLVSLFSYLLLLPVSSKFLKRRVHTYVQSPTLLLSDPDLPTSHLFFKKVSSVSIIPMTPSPAELLPGRCAKLAP